MGRALAQRRTRCAAPLFAAATLISAAAMGAESGANIYQDGRDQGPAIQARLAAGQLLLPATGFRCASCHGLDGMGKREGANRTPPATWEALATPRPESAEWRARPAYDDASLARAVMDGVDPAGRRLSTAMPRYAFSDPQRAALTAYLKELGRGDTQEAGVSPTIIRVGAALPLTGPQAAMGEAVRQLLTAMLARESETGIYGRRLELVVADTAAAAANAALMRLVEAEHVFALIATQLPTDASGLDPAVPIVGDLDNASKPPSRRIFRIAAPIADRVAVLLWQAEQCDGPNLRVAVIGQADAAGRAAFDAPARAPIRMVLDWHDLARPDAAIAAAMAAGAQAILALAPRDTVVAIRAAMLAEGVTLPLLVPGQPDEDVIAGATVALSPSSRRPMRLAFAGLSPDQIDETGFRTVTTSGPSGGERSLRLYAAYASAVIFLEAVKQAGRRLDRAALVEALEGLREVHTGVLPPISFGRSRHEGLSGAAVVGFAADGHATFLAPWRPAVTFSHGDVGCSAETSPLGAEGAVLRGSAGRVQNPTQ